MIRRSLRSWLWRVPVDQEVEEEIAFHLEMRTRELMNAGLDREAAREQALARLGDLSRLKRTCVDLGRKRDREMWLTRALEELGHDVTFALRQLRASPGFALVATITLALGIGANSAIFALVDATLLRPLPYRDPERLVMVSERSAQFPRTAVAPLNFRDWNERNTTFDSMAAVFSYPRRMTNPDGTVEQVPAQQVTPAFFDLLGVRPILGRTFRPSDEALPPNVTVISERLWEAPVRWRPASGRVNRPHRRPAIHGARDRSRRFSDRQHGRPLDRLDGASRHGRARPASHACLRPIEA